MAPHPRILIADKLSPLAAAIFAERGIETETRTGLGKDELAEIIGHYDGMAVRSATKVTAKALAKANGLKIIGRAGIGVDNIDVPAATSRGVIVMNTPFGNSITTAEHAISLLMALARQIPEADRSTRSGQWEKSKFLGVEVTSKILGIVGCGNIGSVVADRAQGLRMKVIAYDPFLSPERAFDLGVEKVELDDLFRRADFVTLHTPLTDKTRGLIGASALAKMKKGVRIVNCARGGLIVEEDLAAALRLGHVAGAALDVFETEPPGANPLFGLPNVICTPHLGASTAEAQAKVAQQIAQQMSDYLLDGAISNAVNFPAISAEEAPKLKPFVALAEKLGSFAGQLTETGLKLIRIDYAGDIADMNTRALTAAALAGVLRPLLQDVNMVSAPFIARERGLLIEEVRRAQAGAYETFMGVTLRTERQDRSVSGTVFSDGKPRIVQINAIPMDAAFAPNLLYTENADKPGHIGALGTLLANEGVNIATFNLGRDEPGGKAVALVSVDERVTDAVLDKVRRLPHVVRASRLSF
jgi:D-3-phosphoglycerate dehydrogenase